MSKADDIAHAKEPVARSYLSDDGFVCPIGQRFTHCIDCLFTDKVGTCCWPVYINAEIKAGRAMPYIHDYNWPEREADFERRLEIARARPCKL